MEGKEMIDIVERLRSFTENDAYANPFTFGIYVFEAADEIERLRAKLISEREENLWHAYNTGFEKEEEWTHCFMSDGEWLVGELGLDPKQGYYPADVIKSGIPNAARNALKETE